MTQHDLNRIAELVRRTDPRAILRAAGVCDGHGIVEPAALIDAGLPEEVVAQLTATHRSGDDHKSTLYVDGRPVEAVTGVYGLDALRFIALALGVAYPTKLGRGSQAAAIRSALREHLSGADAATTS